MTPLLRFTALLRRVFRCETPFRKPAPKQEFVATSEQQLFVPWNLRDVAAFYPDPDGSGGEWRDLEPWTRGWLSLRYNRATRRYEWQADDERSWED